MGDIKAAKIAFLINQPFPLIYFPFAHMPVCPHESVCECVHVRVCFSCSPESCEEQLSKNR